MSLMKAGPAAVLPLLLMAVLPPGVAAATTGREQVTRLRPTGVDDTLALQAALESCSGAAAPCRIELSAGVFYTDVLLVRHFRGRIAGEGRGRTIIRPLAGTPLRSTAHVFLADPTLAEPYPILLHFADGGDVTLEHFTLDVPANLRVSPWSLDGGVSTLDNALLSAIMVDGAETDRARLVVLGVEVAGRRNTQEASFGSNVMNAIRFEGQIRHDPANELGKASPLGGGQFVAYDVRIARTGLGFALRDARELQVLIAGSTIDNTRTIGVFLTDLGASNVVVTANRIASDLVGIQWLRGVRPSDRPSKLHAFANAIEINRHGSNLFDPGDAIIVADVTVFDDPVYGGLIDTVSIRFNRVWLGVDVYDAVFVLGDRGKVTVAHNELSGPALLAGVSVEESRGTQILGNKYSGFRPAPDVWLLPTTSECRVLESGRTMVLDEGTGNIVNQES